MQATFNAATTAHGETARPAADLIEQANTVRAADVLRSLGVIVGKGGVFTCPSCKEHKPTATFRDDNGDYGRRWRCPCAAGGSLVDLVVMLRGHDDENAARVILGKPLVVDADGEQVTDTGEIYTSTKQANGVEIEMPAFVGRETRAGIEVMSNGSTRAAVRPRGSDDRQGIRLMSDQNAVDASSLIAAETTLDAAKIALKIGLRPIPVYAIGETYMTSKGVKTSDGKPPIGGAWGKKTWTESRLDKTFGQNANRNVGLLMGPQGGIIDIEMDRPQDMDIETFDRLADEELAELCGGEIPDTVGWRSGRGVHRIFRWDDRLAACAEREKNAFHHGRLEFRLGAGKQIQSVIPPSRHANGERVWLDGSTVIARLPDVAIDRIIEAAKPKLKPDNVKPKSAEPVFAGDADHVAKRLYGLTRSLAQNILSAPHGDANKGRHPTALASARTIAGLVKSHDRHDLADGMFSILIEAYRASKPELPPDDPEFEQCISDGWNYGLTGEGLTLDERNGKATKTADKVPQPSGKTDQIKGRDEPFGGLTLGPPATLATFRKMSAEREFIWDYFLAKRCLNLIDGAPGVGKSRFKMDLVRRVGVGENWPDGRPMKLPPDTRFLWVAADSNYDQLVETATAFGISDDALIFPGDEANPYDFTDLTNPDTIEAVTSRVAEFKPDIVVIDTATNACGEAQQMDRTQIGKIAKALARLANEHNVAIVLLGHQNAKGGSYGDSWPANVDSRIKMEEDGDAVRIELVKSRWDKNKAAVLRGRQSDEGWTYDVEPRDIRVPSSGSQGETMTATEKAKAAVLDYAVKYPETKKSEVVRRVVELTSLGKSTVYTAIEELVRDDQIVCAERDFGTFKADVLLAREIDLTTEVT